MPAFLKVFIESASFFGNNIPIVAVASLSFIAYLVVSGYLREAVFFSFLYSVFCIQYS